VRRQLVEPLVVGFDVDEDPPLSPTACGLSLIKVWICVVRAGHSESASVPRSLGSHVYAFSSSSYSHAHSEFAVHVDCDSN